MAAEELKKISFRSRYYCLSGTECIAAYVLIIIVLSSTIQGKPLVYPNRFSFQKTSTTSTTQIPLLDHDHSNNSISSVGKMDSGLSSSNGRSFRYDIAGWTVGALLLVCLLFLIFYPKVKRRHDIPSTSACYAFPVNSNLKPDLDSTSIIANANPEML